MDEAQTPRSTEEQEIIHVGYTMEKWRDSSKT